MEIIKVGVLGGNRGNTMIEQCKKIPNARIVAICDYNKDTLERQKSQNKDNSIKYYSNYEEMLNGDVDAIVLANYAHQHAPFAIKALKAGKHVFSEVLPVQNMAEAVALIEAVEESGNVYAYGENYCFMPAPREMRKLYQDGVLGEFEYGEGEYLHNCEPIWPSITYGDKNHWRNRLMYSTFYCTHSIGPLIHVTGLRPVRVTGFEGVKMERNLRCGALGGQFGMEIIQLENGGIIKSTHGFLYENSIWYSLYGAKGRVESAREDTSLGGVERVYLKADTHSGAYNNKEIKSYTIDSDNSGHGGSDFIIFNNFIDKILGKDAEIIDVYEALDMFLPGLFAYRSILKGNIPMDIPNLRNKSERDVFRYDVTCCDNEVASGESLLPPNSVGITEIPDLVYEQQLTTFEKNKNKK